MYTKKELPTPLLPAPSRKMNGGSPQGAVALASSADTDEPLTVRLKKLKEERKEELKEKLKKKLKSELIVIEEMAAMTDELKLLMTEIFSNAGGICEKKEELKAEIERLKSSY